MKQAYCRWFGIVSIATVALGIAACSGGQDEGSEGEGEHTRAEAAAEHARAEGAAEASSEGSGEHARSEGEGEHARSEGEGEHARSEGSGEGGEGEGEHGQAGHDEEGEESGVYIGKEETWDVVRRGARLVLKFDAASNAFVGTVENTTASTLCAIRVEVHLSTGTELGPTPRTDVRSGQKTDVTLSTEGEAFDTWTAHPEVSACSGG
jgi:hypothetical protein